MAAYPDTIQPPESRLTGGFGGVETLLVIIIAAALVSIGYFVWQHHQVHTALQTQPASAKSVPGPAARTGSNNVQPAPQVNNTAELNNALQALNQANISSNNTDSSSLSSNTAGF